MKALTILQPWASLIVAGAKPYEFRSRRAPRSLIGQRVVIHAGKDRVPEDEVRALFHLSHFRNTDALHRECWAETCLIAEKAQPVLSRMLAGELPMSAGVGTAILGEPRLGPEIAEEFGVPRANDSVRDQHANWGWPMLDVERWPDPIPMRGAQGFWNWPDASDFGGSR